MFSKLNASDPFLGFERMDDDRRFKLRVQDILLTVMFGALIFLAHDIWEKSFILGLAILQLVEGRIPFLTTLWGRTTSVVLQLIIVWLLDRLHGRSNELVLPDAPAAACFGGEPTPGVAGTLAISIAAIGAYLSFLLYLNFAEAGHPAGTTGTYSRFDVCCSPSRPCW